MRKKVFVQVSPKTFKENAIKLIGDDWMLVTAGTPEKYNTMTASWGGLGVMWYKPTTYIFIRPTRYTYELLEESTYYTICFLSERFRDVLNFCGTKSGRDVNKIEETGLKPIINEKLGTIHYEQSKIILTCKKMYHADINPEGFDIPALEMNYTKKDYHRLYIGEIVDCWVHQKLIQ